MILYKSNTNDIVDRRKTNGFPFPVNSRSGRIGRTTTQIPTELNQKNEFEIFESDIHKKNAVGISGRHQILHFNIC